MCKRSRMKKIKKKIDHVYISISCIKIILASEKIKFELQKTAICCLFLMFYFLNTKDDNSIFLKIREVFVTYNVYIINRNIRTIFRIMFKMRSRSYLINLKELQNYNQNLFCVRQKGKQKYNQHFDCHFS